MRRKGGENGVDILGSDLYHNTFPSLVFFTCFLYLQGPFGLLEKVQEEEEKSWKLLKHLGLLFKKQRLFLLNTMRPAYDQSKPPLTHLPVNRYSYQIDIDSTIIHLRIEMRIKKMD